MRRVTQMLGTGLVALAAAGTAAAGQVRYMMWDSAQLPAYRQCAADFSAAHPGTTIKISQAGWGDYWTAISTGFIAESAPDVFVNHLGKAPQFIGNDLLVDLTPYIRRDGLDLRAFPAGLVDVWARDGRHYGLPKDWDTVALMVNLRQARAAGVSLAELQTLTWNPRDGGSFEQVVRRLTLDSAGRNALQPGFDKTRVVMWGYQNPGPGGMAGQTEWSHFAASTGWRAQDRPWAWPLHFDDPRLAQTLDWLAGLPAQGLSAPPAVVQSLGAGALFVAGKVAMVPDGAWMVGYYAANARFDTAWVPLPVGPSGQRASMLNGVADSIWVGSKVKEEAWQWVKYLASDACQAVVAAKAVVLPARQGMAERALAVHRARGIDAQAFLTMAGGPTVLMPMADRGAEVDALIKGAIESVLLGREAAGPALQRANDQVNRLLQGPGPRR